MPVMRKFWIYIFCIFAVSCSVPEINEQEREVGAIAAPELKYGLEIERYDIEPGEIKKGDLFPLVFYVL